MKREFRIKTDDISNLTLSDIMAEIDKMNLDVPPGIGFDVEAAANQIYYNDEDYVIEYDDDKIEPDIGKMTQQELIDLANQVDSGESGLSFEESAKYWRDRENQEQSDLFTAMAARWWELEEKSHAVETKPIAKIRNINPAWGDPIEFADADEMAMLIEMCGYELPEDGLIEGRDYERISTAD